MQRLRGFTLVELMIALVLGLVIIGGVINIFLANREAYRTQQNLARIMDNARVAFELMAREVREAGANACGTSRVVNMLNDPAGDWWRNWAAGGLVGYRSDQEGPIKFDTGGKQAGQRVQGTDAVLIRTATMDDALTIIKHPPNSSTIFVNKEPNVSSGDIAVVCDDKLAAIIQITPGGGASFNVNHNPGGAVSPGNCSQKISAIDPCNNNPPDDYSFQDGGMIVKLHASFWYIGHNGRGGTSLYRLSMTGNPNNAAIVPQEIAEGVTNMELRYLPFQGTDYVAAGSITNWPQVMAVRITLTLQSGERVGLGWQNNTLQTQALQRRITHVVQLRNQTEL